MSKKNEASLGLNLYEANKQLMSKEPVLDPIAAANKLSKVAHDMLHGRYYMLLNNERRDYTIFHISKESDCQEILNELKDILRLRGTIISIDKVENCEIEEWEIWIREKDDTSLWVLMDCNNFVVEVL